MASLEGVHMPRIYTYVSICLVAVTLQGCLTSRGEFGYKVDPVEIPLSSPRTVSYPAVDANGSKITVGQVVRAVAEAFPRASRYRELQGRRSLKTTAKANQVYVEYLAGLSSSSGEHVTVSRAILHVQLLGTDTISRFSIVSEPLATEVAFGPGFIPVPAVDTAPKLAEDVAQVLSNFEPVISLSFTHREEFDALYTPAAVFANFERMLGKASPPRQRSVEPEVREGVFDFRKEQSIVEQFFVQVFPYRDKAKVRVSFTVPYTLRPGGTSTFPAAIVEQVKTRARQIALD